MNQTFVDSKSVTTPLKIYDCNAQNCVAQTPPTIILQPENVNIFSENDDFNDSDQSNAGLEIVENIRKNKTKKRKR